MAELCETTRNTTYSWFAPLRDAKVPLKVIIKAAIALNVSLDDFFVIPPERNELSLRKKSQRPSYEKQISEYVKYHPGKSIDEIATALNISSQTVRRHLNHLQKHIHER